MSYFFFKCTLTVNLTQSLKESIKYFFNNAIKLSPVNDDNNKNVFNKSSNSTL